MTPEQMPGAASRSPRARGAPGATRADVKMIEYIRICVDDDEDAARRAFVRALMGYAMARPGVSKALGYRGHFGRMGFDEALNELEERRDRGASDDELVDAFPLELAPTGRLLRPGQWRCRRVPPPRRGAGHGDRAGGARPARPRRGHRRHGSVQAEAVGSVRRR